MKKNALLLVLMVLILGLGAYFIMKGISKPEPQNPLSNQATGNSQNDSLVAGYQIDSPQLSNVGQTQKAARLVQSVNSNAGWRTYTNNKLGFSFQYPGNWFKDGEEASVTNLKGAITEVDVQFRDSSSKTSLLVAYHLAPAGATLYEYELANFTAKTDKYAIGSKQIEVGGVKALVSTSVGRVDGRGHTIEPIKFQSVSLLDKSQKGEIEFQFQTPASGAVAQETMFDQLLASFRFTK